MVERRIQETRSRSEITENVDHTEAEIQEKTEIIEEKVCDVETEYDTAENLELSGTTEGAESVEQDIHEAQDVSSSEFTDESNDLEQMHEETEQNEGELSEKAESVSTDIEKISDAAGKLNSENARERFNEADQAAQEDMEFLNEHKQKLEQIRQDSVNEHTQHEQRVNSNRRN